MKPEKLKSGKWRVRVYIGEENGKKKWKSITANTKAESLRKAALVQPVDVSDMSVGVASQSYIQLKEPVLSPSTMIGYNKIYNSYIKPLPFAQINLQKLTSVKVQQWVSDLARTLSPKSVRNAYGFLTAVISMYAPNLKIRVKLPQRRPQTLYTPTTADINAVLDVADPELKKAILLGATGMMRRSEICALTADDVDYENNTITIRQSLVLNDNRDLVLKAPKTDSSFRTVEVNKELIDLLPKDGPLVSLNPDQITMRFNRAVTKAGVKHFRFHDLRHYAASIAVSSAIGAGSLTVQGRGGWQSDYVMKRTYSHSLTDQAKSDTGKIIVFFANNIHFNTENSCQLCVNSCQLPSINMQEYPTNMQEYPIVENSEI